MLPPQVEKKLWTTSLLWGVCFFAFWGFYDTLRLGAFTATNVIADLEWTAAVLIGISYAFGTFTFYTNFLDRELIYRKYFGLVGYVFLLVFTVALIYSHPQQFLLTPFAGFIALEFQYLVVILLVLSAMTIIGNNEELLHHQSKLWRNLLRAGYIIYAFWIPRSVLMDGHLWNLWGQGQSGYILPPASLVVTVSALLIVAFRLSVFPVLLWRRYFKKNIPPPSTTTEASV